jgi:hypothetical protein
MIFNAIFGWSIIFRFFNWSPNAEIWFGIWLFLKLFFRGASLGFWNFQGSFNCACSIMIKYLLLLLLVSLLLFSFLALLCQLLFILGRCLFPLPFYFLVIMSYPNKIWKRFLPELVLWCWQEESEVRFCAVRWATSLFDFQHCPSRFICMLGAADGKLDIRYNKFLLQCADMLWWVKAHLKGFCLRGLVASVMFFFVVYVFLLL